MQTEELLKILACPKCHGTLVEACGQPGFLCGHCQLVYPVRDEIPIMLIEEAIPANQWPNGSKGE